MTHKAFRRIQISDIEDTAGSAEAAVTALYGTMTFEEVLAIHWPDGDRNNLSRHMADDQVMGEEMHMTWTSPLNARDAVWPAGAAIVGAVSASQPNSTDQPNAYLWTHEISYTSANTPNSYTIEFGDNTQCYEAEYCFVSKWTLSGAVNEPIISTVEWIGRQRTDASFTGSKTVDTTVEILPFNLSVFSIDTSWANLGNTAKPSTLAAFTWEFETMFRPLYAADGTLYFTSLAEDKKSPHLTLTYIWNATSDAERTKYEARTTSYLRLKMLGSTVIDSGQANPPYVQLDQAIRYATWPEWGEQDGLTTYQVEADCVYDSTGASMFEMTILNDYAAIT